MRNVFLLVIFLLPSCSPKADPSVLMNAVPYIGHSEENNRKELIELIDVDPVKTEWCAAFVNSVLESSLMPSLNTPGATNCSMCKPDEPHPFPLVARSFLDWGVSVHKDEIYPGDIVIFPRGDTAWTGHVGFYIKSVDINGKLYYSILGGNQNNKVSIELYRADNALGIRRISI